MEEGHSGRWFAQVCPRAWLRSRRSVGHRAEIHAQCHSCPKAIPRETAAHPCEGEHQARAALIPKDAICVARGDLGRIPVVGGECATSASRRSEVNSWPVCEM